jgi:hypothetical protein
MSKVFALDGTNNKAVVVTDSGISTLTSYNTEVAEYNHNSNTMTVNGIYSATTLKHIKKFLEFYGYPPMTKQEIIKKFNLTENI